MMNETKRKIVRAWVCLLAEHPLEKIHIRDILDLAEVSRDTFYYYFDGIAGMPAEIIIHETDAILEKLDVAETAGDAIHELLSFLKNRRVMLHRIYESGYRANAAELADTVALKLARILLAGKGEKGSYKSFACEMLSDGISGCIRRFMAGDENAVLTDGDFSAMLMRYAENSIK